MEKKLYAPPNTEAYSERPLRAANASAPSGWVHNDAPLPTLVRKSGMSGATLFLIFAALFFVIAGSVAAWLLIGGGRSVSTDHITMSVENTQHTIAGGDTVSFPILIKNGNPVAITDANITIDFPEGTYSAEQDSKPVSHVTESLGEIPAGASLTHTVRAILFGSENQHVTVPITLEYKTEGSNAVFIKKAEHALTIGSAPVSINVQTLSEVSSGQPITFSVSIRSNAATPLENVAIVATYPFGFTATAADPQPSTGNLFSLGTLAPGEEKKIKITGTLTGTDNEQRVFHFDAGNPQPSGGTLAVTYNGTDVPVTVTKPFLAVKLKLDDSEEDPIIVQSDESIQGLLTWENTLASAIQNGQVSVALGGSALDAATVFTPGGFFRSSDSTILFNSDKDPGLKQLKPGDTGNGSFTMKTKTGSALSSLRNPSITVTVSVSGRRVGESGVSNEVASTIKRTLKVATDFLISSRVVRTVGPFTNTGPWPPVANQASTYTVMLSVSNSVNSVADAAATMTLPSYVSFTGKVSGQVTYNENTRTVTWDLSDVPAGVTREAAFQVSLTPSTSQKGTAPVIVSEQTLTGFDRFISRQVKSASHALDIRTETDPAYQFSQGEVQR
jgi:hypothetical protein